MKKMVPTSTLVASVVALLLLIALVVLVIVHFVKREDCPVCPPITTCEADLTACEADLLARDEDLTTCEADLLARDEDLATCGTDLTGCEVDLATHEKDLTTCETALALAQGGVTVAACQATHAVSDLCSAATVKGYQTNVPIKIVALSEDRVYYLNHTDAYTARFAQEDVDADWVLEHYSGDYYRIRQGTAGSQGFLAATGDFTTVYIRTNPDGYPTYINWELRRDNFTTTLRNEAANLYLGLDLSMNNPQPAQLTSRTQFFNFIATEVNSPASCVPAFTAPQTVRRRPGYR